MHEVFVNKAPKDQTVINQFEQLKGSATYLMDNLDRLMKESPSTGRYIALAKTSLEESVMWATKAIALGDLNKD